MEKLICKIWKAQKKGQLFVTIPRKCGLKPGDYVTIRKVELVDLDGGMTIGTG
jgi:hypothetical protein